MKVHYTPTAHTTTQPLHDALLSSNESITSSCSPLNHRAQVEVRQTEKQSLDKNDSSVHFITARSLAEAKDRFHSCVARGLSLLVNRYGYGRRRAIRLILDQIRQSDPLPSQDQIFRGMQVIGMGMDAITHTIIVSNALEKIKAERGLNDIEAIEHLSSRLTTGALLNSVKQLEDRDMYDDERMEMSGSEKKDIIMTDSVIIDDAAIGNGRRSSVTSTSSSGSGISVRTTHLMKVKSPHAHSAPNSVPVSVSSPSISCNNTSTTCEETQSIIHTKNSTSTNTTTNMNTSNSHNNSSTSSSTPKSNKIRKHSGSSKNKSSRVMLKTPKTQRQKRKSSSSSSAMDMTMAEESETNVNAKFKVVAEKQKALSSSSSPSSSNGHGHGHCASSSSVVGPSPTSSTNGSTSTHSLVVGNKRKSVGGTDGVSSDVEAETHSRPSAPKRQRLDSI